MSDRHHHDYTGRHIMPRGTPANSETPLIDDHLLGKLMHATVQHERDMQRLEGKVDAQGVDMAQVSKTAQDLAFVRRTAAWALSAVLPFAVTGIITMIQSHQRLNRLEEDLTSYNDRSGKIQADLTLLRDEINVLAGTEKERQAQRELLERLNKQLDELAAPKKRRR